MFSQPQVLVKPTLNVSSHRRMTHHSWYKATNTQRFLTTEPRTTLTPSVSGISVCRPVGPREETPHNFTTTICCNAPYPPSSSDEPKSLACSFQKQAGFDCETLNFVTQSLREMFDISGLAVSDDLISEIEGIVALFLTLQGCADTVSMLSAVFLYVRTHFSTSITCQVVKYATSIFNSGGFTPQSDSPAWLDLMRNARTNWSQVKHSPLFGHFSKLLGLMVTLGMCKASDVSFDIKGFQVFEPDMKIVHGSALDVADAAFETVTFFVENMYECFQAKSLKPILISDKEAAFIDEEYQLITLWWELVRNGNLEKVTEKSESEFDNRLEALATKIKVASNMKSAFEKKLMLDKYARLLTIKNDYVTLKIRSGVRRAPFAVELCGSSAQGKTTLGDQIVDALLRSANLPTDKEYRGTYNANDEYMSIWRTSMNTLLIDDIANDKSNFVKRPPTRIIIDACNNQNYAANMADLPSKGKVFVEPELVIVNTNVKDLDAYQYSNNPYSIQRRMHIVITVEAKPEFQFVVDGVCQGINTRAIREFNKKNGFEPTFDDIWVLSLEKALKPADESKTATYIPLHFRGKKMSKVSFSLALQFLIEEFHEHRADQFHIIESKKNRCEEMQLCGYEGCKQIKGYCDLHDHFTKQMGPEPEETNIDLLDPLWDGLNSAQSIVTNRIKQDVAGVGTAVTGAATLALMHSAKTFAGHWDWLTMVPTPFIEHRHVQNFLMACDYPRIRRTYISRTVVMWGALGVGSFFTLRSKKSNWFKIFAMTHMSIFGLYSQKNMARVVQDRYRKELLQRNTVAPCVKTLRDKHISTACKATAIVAAVYALARIYRRWRSLKQQGSLEPETQADIDRRDAEVNPWIQVSKRSLPLTVRSLCTTPLDLLAQVEKNLLYGTIIAKDRKLQVNCLMLKSNVLVIPGHYFEVDSLDCTFRKKNPETAGGKFATRLHKNCSVHVPETDLYLCYTPTGGSFKDLTEWFPTENLPGHQFSLLWRGKDGDVIRADGLSKACVTTNSVCNFVGGEYQTLSINTRPGLCGATLVSHGKGASISGFHLGGRTGTQWGCYGVLTQSQIRDGLLDLAAKEGVMLTGCAEHFEKQVLGVNLTRDTELHPKSPLNFMPENSQIEYLGACPGQTTSHSDAKVTVISEAVMDVTGQPNVYRGPVMKPEWFGWQTCLANMAVPALPFEYDLMEICIKDYKEDLYPIFRSKLWNDAAPLPDNENINGIPGKKFMDAIKMNTSIGYPLSGPKHKFVIELDPTEEYPSNRTFEPVIFEEIARCEKCYERGERAYTIAKACKKDEILAKEKCRIFYSNPISLTFLIRKYYLPLLRVLQMNPLVSECAVGINCHGPEWEEFFNHALHFGEDRILGGDYGKYDQKLSSQLILSALRILIDFARECNYSERDLKIMETMAGDIVYSLIAFNGDLIGLTEGTHISGNSLTVIINGICGSLNLRAAFYSLYKPESFDTRKKFRKFVKLMTYGDDNIGSVSREIDGYNIKYISLFLEKYGQTYTMPDKESELTAFLPLAEFEFLKRASVYCIKRSIHLGALSEKSIFKMLHMYLRPKKCDITEELAAALNVDTALREWANHGEEIYEKRREQMIEVAERCNIKHLCTQLNVPFDEVVELWFQKYEPEKAKTAVTCEPTCDTL